ncbi:MAG: MGH1-like glycoside hydrolase domain-containing protein, partial [Kiritimatiellia bacterium]
FKKKTSCGFWPMIAGVASQAQVKRLVAHLKDEKKFWRPFVFPTLSADEPEYKPDGDYWLGAVWAPTNYAIIKGLELYGEEDFATEAALRYVRAMFEVYKRTGTVWENYAPESMSQGTPAKPDFVGWSGIGPITLLIENVLGFRPDGVRKQLAWRLARHDRHGIERFRFGTVQTDLLYDGKGSVCVRTNEPFTLALNGVEYKLAKGEHRLAAKPR